MKRTFLMFSLLAAGATLLMGSTDAEARCRCRCRGGYRYQAAYYQPTNGCNVAGATTTDPYAAGNPNAAAPTNAPAPPQEQAPAPAPGT